MDLRRVLKLHQIKMKTSPTQLASIRPQNSCKTTSDDGSIHVEEVEIDCDGVGGLTMRAWEATFGGNRRSASVGGPLWSELFMGATSAGGGATILRTTGGAGRRMVSNMLQMMVRREEEGSQTTDSTLLSVS